MKPEFVRCAFCQIEMPSKTCKLAAQRTEINGKEYIFCCSSCEKQYRNKHAKPVRKKSK